jgi:hypothetical protein
MMIGRDFVLPGIHGPFRIGMTDEQRFFYRWTERKPEGDE